MSKEQTQFWIEYGSGLVFCALFSFAALVLGEALIPYLFWLIGLVVVGSLIIFGLQLSGKWFFPKKRFRLIQAGMTVLCTWLAVYYKRLEFPLFLLLITQIFITVSDYRYNFPKTDSEEHSR